MEELQELIKLLNVADIVIVLVVLMFALRCTMRGFVKEVFSLVGLIGSVIVARLYYKVAGEYFMPWVGDEMKANVIGFAAICVAIIISASLASWLISMLVKQTFLGCLDRIGGFAVGALQGMVLVGIFLMITETVAGSLDKTFVSGSVLAPMILEVMRLLSGIIFKTVMPAPGPDAEPATVQLLQHFTHPLL